MFFSLWKKLFILSFFLSTILSEIVVLNFNRIKDIYDDDDEQVCYNILKNDIYCNITVGKQIIPFSIVFDKELTYIVDKNYSYSKYDTTKSNTYQKKSEKSNNYVFEHLQFGYNSTEQFNLKDENNDIVKVENMPFVLGTYVNPKSDFKFPAQLGLKKRTYQNPFIFNFIEHLKLKRIINSQVFFFKFDETEGGGKLFIGSYPHEFDKDYDAKYLIQSSSLEMGTSNNWFLHFNYFFYGKNKTDIQKQITELSPEKGMIVLNFQLETPIFDSFFKSLIEKKKCVRIIVKFYVYYVCQDDIDINNFKNITFRHIGMEYDFILEPKDLFYHYYDRYFFLISFKNSIYNYLGKPFFKKFNLVFNQDSRQLAIYSFYEATNKKIQKISLFIPMILIIIFIILLSVFIYALSVYRLKKKKKNEIIEEYEYTPSQEINSQNKVKDTRLLEMTSSQII